MNATVSALFYASELPVRLVAGLVYGSIDFPPVDFISFDDEDGGTQSRMLALPYLAGMDTVTVTDASFEFRTGEFEKEISSYSESPALNNQGAVLRLQRPSHLRKVEIELGGTSALPDPSKMRIILRPVDGNSFGPPVFSAPDFAGAGSLFGRVLSGMSRKSLGSNRYLIELPDVLGSDWAIQVAVAEGNKVTNLGALSVPISIRRVVIAAAPHDLSVTLKSDPPSPLWGNSGALLSSSGLQQVSFLPLAQKKMREALESVSPDALTLPLEIDFTSGSAGQLLVTSRSLAGYYSADPLQGADAKLRMGGRTSDIELSAPSGLNPIAGELALTAKLVGARLNAGSNEAPRETPSAGLRANKSQRLAARMAIAPRPGARDGQPVPITVIAGYFEAAVQTECVIEFHEDAAGKPGATLGVKLVRQFAPGEAGWFDLPLDEPLEVTAGTAIWATLRVTKGEIFWHYDAQRSHNLTGVSLISVDEGLSWGHSSINLAMHHPLLVQAFHEENNLLTRPRIRLSLGDRVLEADWFAKAVQESPGQFRLVAKFPLSLLSALGQATDRESDERSLTSLSLYSDTVLDLSICEARLDYDPASVRQA